MRMILLPLLLAFSCQVHAQSSVPREVEQALARIEQAFRTASPQSIEDLVMNGITMRLEDSLYSNISCIAAQKLLNTFFADIDSVSFQLTTLGSGRIRFVRNGTHEELQVDVFLARQPMGAGLRALNISNYPTATMFFHMDRGDGKAPH